MNFVYVVSVNMSEARRTLLALESPALVTDAVREARQAFVDLTKQRFLTGTDPFGTPWVPIKPSTARVRAGRGGSGNSPLVDSGALAASVRGDGRGNSVKVVVGGPGMFADIHQEGNPSNRMFGQGSAPIPARPFIPDGDLPETYWSALIGPFNQRISEAFR